MTAASDLQPKVPFPLHKREWQPSLIPGTIALISTVDSEGTPNVAPKSWLQMVAFEPPMLMFSGSKNGTTECNALATDCFAVNIVDRDLAPVVVSCVQWHGEERIERSGFRFSPASKISAPLVDNCKAHLECRLQQAKEVGSGFVLFAEIVAASIREDILGAEPRARYARLEQVVFLEDGLFGSLDRAHPAAMESLSSHTTRYVMLLSHARPELFNEGLVRAHVAHLRRLEDQGLVEICGPFPDHQGGMVVLRVASEAEAHAIAESDPFVSSGAETYELRKLEVSDRDNNHLGMG